jgi:DNA-binding HxlR family transcriptional regulator
MNLQADPSGLVQSSNFDTYTDPMLGKDYDHQDCLVARALEVVGERWTLLIIRDAFFGVRRFSDFREHLDIPKAVLSDRLKSLVAAGVLKRSQEPRRGREVYDLTDAGRALWPVLFALRSWAQNHAPEARSQRVFTHDTCGQALDDLGRCDCATVPAPDEILTFLRPGATQMRRDRVSVALSKPHRLLDPLGVD